LSRGQGGNPADIYGSGSLTFPAGTLIEAAASADMIIGQ